MMATEALTKQFRELINECTQFSIDQILVNPDWGRITFEICRPEIDRTYAMLNQFKLLPLDLLPDGPTQQIISTLPPIKQTLDQIRAFSIELGNPIGTRDQLVNQFKNQADHFFTAAHSFIPYLAYQKGDVQRNISELTRSVEEAGKLVEYTKKDIEDKRGEIGGIIVAAREAAASVGVAHFAADFSAEAASQDQSAKRWLCAAAVLTVVTISVALVMIFVPIKPDTTSPQVLQLFTSKFIILGMLFTATIWCGRLYKATRHQSAINKHRANALRTFQAFTKAASDDTARNAVLMETTKSIFAITSSGYLENEITPDGSLKIVEVVKHVTQAAAAAK
jgi:hypothetical protein